jgi:hypothetical protein
MVPRLRGYIVYSVLFSFIFVTAVASGEGFSRLVNYDFGLVQI